MSNEIEHIKVEKIHIDGNRWFQQTYGNTYHSSRAIINDTYVIETDFEYGYGESYIDTSAKALEKFGLIGADESAFWTFARDNDIEFTYSVSDGRKKDLPFTDSHLWESLDEANIKIYSKTYEDFISKMESIENAYPNDTNASKGLKLLIDTLDTDTKISGLEKLLKRAYELKDESVYDNDERKVKTLFSAVRELVRDSKREGGNLSIDLSKNIEAVDIYKELIDSYQKTINEIKDFGSTSMISDEKIIQRYEKEIACISNKIKVKEEENQTIDSLKNLHVEDNENISTNRL